MKKIILYTLLTALGAPALTALVNLGEGEINLNLSVSAMYDTEIRARNAGQEDFVLSVRPSLTYARPSRNFDFSVTAGLDSRTYLDYDEFNETDFFFDVSISPRAEMQTSRFRFTGDLILNSETRSEAAVGEIVTIRNYGVSGQLIYDPNRRYTVVGDAGYKREDPDSEFYNETERFNLSGTVLVPLREELDIQGSISYQNATSARSAVESDTYTFSAGFSGRLLPKVSGSVSAGIQERRFDALDNQTRPYFSAKVAWAADERTQFNLDAVQSVGTTIDARASESFLVTLRARHSLRRDLSLNGFLGYEDISYDSTVDALTRSDEEFFVGGGLTYQIVRWGSISLEARYEDRSSDTDIFDYDRLRAGAVFRATW